MNNSDIHDTSNPGTSETFRGNRTRKDYVKALETFDSAVCDAYAVGQASENRMESPAIGLSTHVFARMCAHSRSLISACPLSRWTKKEFESWDVSAAAPHARAILEGYLLFFYLITAPDDPEIQRAYVNVIHMYDCRKRIKILPMILDSEELNWFEEQSIEIKERLESIKYFKNLEKKLQNELISGKHLMITPKHEVISAAGIDQKEFDFFWNYFSQYTHILSFTFHRMEPNGRGTGMENGFDRDALCLVLGYATHILNLATDKMVETFPGTRWARKGLNSTFSPGPIRNLPKEQKQMRKAQIRR